MSAVHEPLVIFVDIDDTLVRSFGSKRIAMSSMVDRVRALHAEGAVLYAWSSGGADYARSSAEELGIGGCFVAFLPKPDVFIDDVRIEAWRNASSSIPTRPPTGHSKSCAPSRSPHDDGIRSNAGNPLHSHYTPPRNPAVPLRYRCGSPKPRRTQKTPSPRLFCARLVPRAPLPVQRKENLRF